MEFTYKAYESLIALLRENGYAVRNYHNWETAPRCVILRHDIDFSLDSAVELAALEQRLGVSSTYFVLLTSDFYNPASPGSLAKLRTIQSMGHEIGLHFDAKAYPEGTEQELVEHIRKEMDILSQLLGGPVSTMSMHRPSATVLESNLKIQGVEISYEKTFFCDFKYLSDSRRHWREPVLDIIRSQAYDHLHILTHAFWYHQQEQDIAQSVTAFVRSAAGERYLQMADNIRSIGEILQKSEV